MEMSIEQKHYQKYMITSSFRSLLTENVRAIERQTHVFHETYLEHIRHRSLDCVLVIFLSEFFQKNMANLSIHPK